MKRTAFASFGYLLTTLLSLNAQKIKVPPLLEYWDTISANISNETFLGKDCIVLKSGAIIAKNVQLRDGTIEADISFSQQRSFPGILFRMEDNYNFEQFYVRPHQSGNPDATQYTPVFNGYAGWQLYHGEGYTKPFTFKFDQWLHLKIELHGLRAEIYLDDMQIPLIEVKELLNGWKTGRLGFASGGTVLRVANVEYASKQVAAPTAMAIPANGAGGLITHWQVSVSDKALFQNQYKLSREVKEKLTWSLRNTEASGTLNMARFIHAGDTGKVVIGKLIIHAESEQTKKLSFGFSDYVTIFLNDKAVYSGADNFMSRDYRFLGTIGFFDALFLPLRKGDNELWFVVSEDFGGWGVKVKLENLENISLK